MKRLAVSVVLSMVFLAAFAAFATFVTKDAVAQVVRAAVVKVVDEPGRNPYQAFRPFSLSTPSTDGSYFCQQPPSQPVCFLLLPDVPAGKRLVVANVTGKISVLAPGFPNAVSLQTSGSLGFANLAAIPMQLLPGVTANTFSYGVNATLRSYVEPGQSPRLQITVIGSPGELLFGSISVSGYLVDLSI